jgi:hypothetical protein
MRIKAVRCEHGTVVAYEVVDALPTDALPALDGWCAVCRLGTSPTEGDDE